MTFSPKRFSPALCLAFAAAAWGQQAPNDGDVTTHHQVVIGGKALHYTAKAGLVPIRDNTTGETRRITETRSATSTIEAPSGLPTAVDSFVAVDISADSGAYPTWNRPIRTYFRRNAGGWTLVGLERLPGKTSTTTTTTTTRTTSPRCWSR